MTRIVWSPRAARDIAAIYARLAERDPSAARKTVALIRSKVDLLGRHPGIGVGRPDIRPEVKMLVAPPYVILYRAVIGAGPNDTEIFISRILDGRRDLKDML